MLLYGVTCEEAVTFFFRHSHRVLKGIHESMAQAAGVAERGQTMTGITDHYAITCVLVGLVTPPYCHRRLDHDSLGMQLGV